LPRALPTEEVQRLEAYCARAKRAPLRLVAMVRLALDLGLRVGEIAKLEIGDFDWRAGTVTLKRTKSQRQDVLPLPAVTGQALSEYMRHERPATTLPSLFVRRLAPHDKPIGVDGVSRAIGRALRSAGISHSCHSLRHTLACRLVNTGSSIKEVADVLRHRSLDTSLIYAKLDLQLLAEVALPWPGSTS
jgi:integrase